MPAHPEQFIYALSNFNILTSFQSTEKIYLNVFFTFVLGLKRCEFVIKATCDVEVKLNLYFQIPDNRKEFQKQHFSFPCSFIMFWGQVTWESCLAYWHHVKKLRYPYFHMPQGFFFKWQYMYSLFKLVFFMSRIYNVFLPLLRHHKNINHK